MSCRSSCFNDSILCGSDWSSSFVSPSPPSPPLSRGLYGWLSLSLSPVPPHPCLTPVSPLSCHSLPSLLSQKHQTLIKLIVCSVKHQPVKPLSPWLTRKSPKTRPHRPHLRPRRKPKVADRRTDKHCSFYPNYLFLAQAQNQRGSFFRLDRREGPGPKPPTLTSLWIRRTKDMSSGIICAGKIIFRDRLNLTSATAPTDAAGHNMVAPILFLKREFQQDDGGFFYGGRVV